MTRPMAPGKIPSIRSSSSWSSRVSEGYQGNRRGDGRPFHHARQLPSRVELHNLTTNHRSRGYFGVSPYRVPEQLGGGGAEGSQGCLRVGAWHYLDLCQGVR